MNQRAPSPHFDLRFLAKSLHLVSIDVIKTKSMDIESHWFRSNGPADLYFWKADNKIVKHQISLFNQVVEWNEYDGVKTGYLNDDYDEGQVEIICFDKEVNPGVVNQAVEFLGSVKGVEPEVVDALISHYRFYNRWSQPRLLKRLKSFIQRLFSAK
jgi:hypothetical protein